MKINTLNKNNNGFTLIELLVVVAIIGLLSSIVITNLSSAKGKGQDAKRLGEIHSIQTALELYFNDYGHYPDVCAASSGGYITTWPTLLSTTYIGSMPNDPINTAGQYGYYYCSQYKPNGKCSFISTPGVNTNYILATHLENTSSSTQSCSGSFGGWDNAVLNYIVGSGQ